MNTEGVQVITHVAIRFQGKIYSLPSPNRHHDVIRLIAKETGEKYIDAHGEDQGFLDNQGRYLTRSAAFEIACEAGQLDKVRPKTFPKHLLFSEDIW